MSDDTISRQAAVDAVKKNTFRLTFAEEQNCEGHVAWSAEAVYSDVMEGALLELPSAQPKKTHGRTHENAWRVFRCNQQTGGDRANRMHETISARR